jgi:hypothetical protein
VAQGSVDLLRLLIIEAWRYPLAKGYSEVWMWDEVKTLRQTVLKWCMGVEGERWKVSSTPGQLTISNPIFLPPAYSPALIYFGREKDWWIICNYPTVLKKKNINRKSTTCAICWLKSVLHEEKCREQENHFLFLPTLWFSWWWPTQLGAETCSCFQGFSQI